MESMRPESFNKISMTATFVAYWRQYSDIPFAKDVAELIDASKTIESFLSTHEITRNEIRWYAPLFEIRHKSIEEVIRRSGITQVLELASGLSFRGLALAQDPDISYVETDLEELTEEKRVIASTLKERYSLAMNSNFRLSAANALDTYQLYDAIDHFKKDQAVAVVNEGLLPYLTMNEMETVTGNIKGILEQFGGMWITPDFSFKENYAEVSAQRIQVRDAIAELTGRRLHRSIFENEEKLFSFLRNMGLQAEAFHQTDLVSSVVSLGALHLPNSFLQKVKPKLNLWVITPAC
jgi:O-methyltransferase involved in polyketide biosynthesis